MMGPSGSPEAGLLGEAGLPRPGLRASPKVWQAVEATLVGEAVGAKSACLA